MPMHTEDTLIRRMERQLAILMCRSNLSACLDLWADAVAVDDHGRALETMRWYVDIRQRLLCLERPDVVAPVEVVTDDALHPYFSDDDDEDTTEGGGDTDPHVPIPFMETVSYVRKGKNT